MPARSEHRVPERHGRSELAPFGSAPTRPLSVIGARDRRRAPRTAFVLAGGAGLGAMQAGMLQALYERGIEPDLLVGTSAGALNAGYIATRPRTLRTIRELTQVWTELRREDIFPIHPPTLISGLANHRDHLVPDRPLRQLIARHLRVGRLEDAEIPLHLVTFDLLRGDEVLLSAGPALEAVLAAVSIPGVLPPVSWGQRLLVDGGVVNNTPISHAVELGAERVYVLPTGDPLSRGLRTAPRGALDAAVHAFTLLADARLGAELARYSREVELIILPATNPRRVQPTDFDHADELISAALHAARDVLQDAHLPDPGDVRHLLTRMSAHAKESQHDHARRDAQAG